MDYPEAILMLTPEECQRYATLRRSGRIGVLWPEGRWLYFAPQPTASGFYRRDEAERIGIQQFRALLE